MNNTPTGMPDPAEQTEIRMMDCPECEGVSPESECCGAAIDTDILICSDCNEHAAISECETCDGDKRIPMTFQDIDNELESKEENKHEL